MEIKYTLKKYYQISLWWSRPVTNTTSFYIISKTSNEILTILTISDTTSVHGPRTTHFVNWPQCTKAEVMSKPYTEEFNDSIYQGIFDVQLKNVKQRQNRSHLHTLGQHAIKHANLNKTCTDSTIQRQVLKYLLHLKVDSCC